MERRTDRVGHPGGRVIFRKLFRKHFPEPEPVEWEAAHNWCLRSVDLYLRASRSEDWSAYSAHYREDSMRWARLKVSSDAVREVVLIVAQGVNDPENHFEDKRIVYMWADGIYCNVRLGDGERNCILVVMGATADGDKELLAVHDGVRESEISWKNVLLDLRERGMTTAPEIAVGDGALGFWKALRQVFPTTREQRCTVHKTVNILNKLPSSMQKDAKRRLHDIFLAPTYRGSRERLRRLRRTLRREVPEGGRMPQEGPRGTAHLLRLPRRALDASADHEPDRIHLRHRPAADQADEGCGLCEGRPRNGLQAGPGSSAKLEKTQRSQAAGGRHHRRPFQGWHQGRRLKSRGAQPQLLVITLLDRSSPSSSRPGFWLQVVMRSGPEFGSMTTFAAPLPTRRRSVPTTTSTPATIYASTRLHGSRTSPTDRR